MPDRSCATGGAAQGRHADRPAAPPSPLQELPALLAAHFPSLDTSTASIMGHSMARGAREARAERWLGRWGLREMRAHRRFQRSAGHRQRRPPSGVTNLAFLPRPTPRLAPTQGGHGALTIALKNPGAYKSVSALAPICNPVAVPWGQKAFTGYFGASRNARGCFAGGRWTVGRRGSVVLCAWSGCRGLANTPTHF